MWTEVEMKGIYTKVKRTPGKNVVKLELSVKLTGAKVSEISSKE